METVTEWTDCLYIDRNEKTVIDKAKSIICLLQRGMPSPEDRISDLLLQIERELNSVANTRRVSTPSQGALNNARGDWFEMLVALGFWQARNSNKEKYQDIVFALLPNRNQLDMFKLFARDEEILLNDLRNKLHQRSIGMITSNPDMIGCLINDPEIKEKMEIPITHLDDRNYEIIDKFYKNLEGKCSRNNLRFGVALKTSTRGDRQLQIPSEGSLWKAIISHLHTRYWESALRFKYHAILMDSLTPGMKDAFNTVATHSITDPNIIPIPATDEAYAVETFGDISRKGCSIFDLALA